MFKTHTLIMLSAIDGVLLKPNIPHRMFMRLNNIKSERHSNQHLYVVSNEEIKEGEILPYLMKWENGYELFNSNNSIAYSRLSRAKRIIASTDSQLNLPQIPQSFISLYIEEYNADRKIEKVDVEYEESNKRLLIETGAIIHLDSTKIPLYIPKINPDNTISIKPLKDSWNREEIETIILNVFRDIDKANNWNSHAYSWLKENL